jgi:hypothetical protein
VEIRFGRLNALQHQGRVMKEERVLGKDLLSRRKVLGKGCLLWQRALAKGLSYG